MVISRLYAWISPSVYKLQTRNLYQREEWNVPISDVYDLGRSAASDRRRRAVNLHAPIIEKDITRLNHLFSPSVFELLNRNVYQSIEWTFTGPEVYDLGGYGASDRREQAVYHGAPLTEMSISKLNHLFSPSDFELQNRNLYQSIEWTFTVPQVYDLRGYGASDRRERAVYHGAPLMEKAISKLNHLFSPSEFKLQTGNLYQSIDRNCPILEVNLCGSGGRPSTTTCSQSVRCRNEGFGWAMSTQRRDELPVESSGCISFLMFSREHALSLKRAWLKMH